MKYQFEFQQTLIYDPMLPVATDSSIGRASDFSKGSGGGHGFKSGQYHTKGVKKVPIASLLRLALKGLC